MSDDIGIGENFQKFMPVENRLKIDLGRLALWKMPQNVKVLGHTHTKECHLCQGHICIWNQLNSVGMWTWGACSWLEMNNENANCSMRLMQAWMEGMSPKGSGFCFYHTDVTSKQQVKEQWAKIPLLCADMDWLLWDKISRKSVHQQMFALEARGKLKYIWSYILLFLATYWPQELSESGYKWHKNMFDAHKTRMSH